MSSIVCENRSCMYNGGWFCKNDFIFLNQIGQCKIWFNDNGTLRAEPLYPAEKSPPSQNSSVLKENGEETANAISTEKSESEKEN